jgi:hypothetical protein
MLARPNVVAQALLTLMFLVAASGCGSSKPKPVTVKGKVTSGGKAVPMGMVILYPDASKGNDSQEEPRGEIDSEGNFTIETRWRQPGSSPGVAPGWYKVAVNAAKPIDPANPYYTAKDRLIPEKYFSHTTSGLVFEVKEDAPSGHYDLKLDALDAK